MKKVCIGFYLIIMLVSSINAQAKVRTFRFEVEPPKESSYKEAYAIVTPDIPEEYYGKYTHDANPILNIKEGFIIINKDGTGSFDEYGINRKIKEWGVLYENGNIITTKTDFYWSEQQTGLESFLLIFHLDIPDVEDKYTYGSVLLMKELDIHGTKIPAMTGGPTGLPFIKDK